QCADVCERVTAHRDDIRIGARCNDPELAALAEELSRARGGGLNRLHRSHAELDHARKLPGNWLRPRETTHVGAESDLDPCTQGLLERYAVNRGTLAVAHASGRVRRSPIIVVDRERRNQPGPLLHHLRDLRVSEVEAMLDGIASAIERAL